MTEIALPKSRKDDMKRTFLAGSYTFLYTISVTEKDLISYRIDELAQRKQSQLFPEEFDAVEECIIDADAACDISEAEALDLRHKLYDLLMDK